MNWAEFLKKHTDLSWTGPYIVLTEDNFKLAIKEAVEGLLPGEKGAKDNNDVLFMNKEPYGFNACRAEVKENIRKFMGEK